MADPVRYTFAMTSVDESQLHEEVLALSLPGFIGLCRSGQTVEFLFADTLSGNQQSNLAGKVNGHVVNPNNAVNRLSLAASAQVSDPKTVDTHLFRAVIRALVTMLNQVRQPLSLPPLDEATILGSVINNLPAIVAPPPPGPGVTPSP